MRSLFRCTVAMVALLAAGAARAEQAYYEVPLRALKLVDGQLPKATVAEGPIRRWSNRSDLLPRVVVDGDAEAYLTHDRGRGIRPWIGQKAMFDAMTVHARAVEGKDVTGHIYLPHASERKMVALRFSIPADDAETSAEAPFLNAKESHYRDLRDRNIPGTAWFRHQELGVRHKEDATGSQAAQPNVNWREQRDLRRTFDLFTGGRAVSENLQLDRIMPLGGEDVEKVPIKTIRGITVEEMDWDAIVAGLKPKTDPLAKYIPADQHVMFFPSFAAAVRLSDEATAQGTPILRLVEPRAEDARTQKRYERQLGCALTAASRLLGPHLVKSIALTGSDPYYRTGTDVAVVFETDQPAVLASMLRTQISMVAASVPGAKRSSGQIEGLSYQLVRSPDRAICSYLAVADDVVILANSPHQLKRLAQVRAGTSPAIKSTPEYRFFRDRYPLGDKDETALLLISDATIRRWCGPRWRIGASRRLQVAAVLADVQASQMDELAKGNASFGPVHTNLPLADGEKLSLTPAGVVSSIHGSLGFLTPIAEIPMTKVTKTEAEGYGRWRDGYEQNWNVGFDPIGFRISVDNERLAGDLTVMPLISATQYRELIDVTAGAQIEPGSGDPHDALVQLVLAINKKSRHFGSANTLASSMKSGLSLGWLGDSVSVYLDKEGSFWPELAAQSGDEKAKDDFLQKNYHRVPVGVRAEVTNGFQLAGFLASGRAWLEQTSPGMLKWDAVEHDGETYVKVTLSDSAKGRRREPVDWAIYYAASGDGLVVSIDETVLQRALARQKQRRQAEDPTKNEPATNTADVPPQRPWLGKNLALRADRQILRILNDLTAGDYQRAMQREAWNNLPILNEWHRRYPDIDPVKLHEQIWGIRLVCPGGGSYVWNDEWQTMESTVYGHPGEPKVGPVSTPVLKQFHSADFGLSFENNGLRARVELERDK
ncbi:MAG: hypothetical protein JW888_08845 [Pirellulales bacterium]|nr:hypothetical protein [Pirellulales bacterium]